jgi:hypothetical protein
MVRLRLFCQAATLGLFWLTGAIAADTDPGGPVPVPQLRPDIPPEAAPGTPQVPQDKLPVPEEKPKTQPEPAAPAGAPDEKQRTESDKPATPDSEGSGKSPAAGEATPPPPIKEDPQAYAACIAALKDAGVEFTESTPIDDGNGCGIEKPVKVRTVLPGIKLEPEATLRCETALTLSRWAKTSVLPAGDIAFGAGHRITAFNQATSYACRNRNSAEAGKLSEHAHGNAIDIAGFTLADGKTFAIAPREKDATLQGAFERAIMATACLFFTTVLGPGSDAAHETHLHLDVLQRKGGYRYCR